MGWGVSLSFTPTIGPNTTDSEGDPLNVLYFVSYHIFVMLLSLKDSLFSHVFTALCQNCDLLDISDV